MLRKEVLEFIQELQKVYPRFHPDGLPPLVADAWTAALSTISAKQAGTALSQYYAGNVRQYPSPSQIAEIAHGSVSRPETSERQEYCGYCDRGDIDYKMPVEDLGGSVYDFAMDCPCRIKARKQRLVEKGRISQAQADAAVAHAIAYVNELHDQGYLPLPYDSYEAQEELPF
jgi:hypothetical protein